MERTVRFVRRRLHLWRDELGTSRTLPGDHVPSVEASGGESAVQWILFATGTVLFVAGLMVVIGFQGAAVPGNPSGVGLNDSASASPTPTKIQGGDVTPTQETTGPSLTAAPTPTDGRTTPSPTSTDDGWLASTPTPTQTDEPLIVIDTGTSTPTPTATSTPTPTPTATSTPTPTPTATSTPTPTPTEGGGLLSVSSVVVPTLVEQMSRLFDSLFDLG